MGGNGKFHKWKISFHKSPNPILPKQPPTEYLCPILDSLMHDPVVVPSGQTFERTTVQVFKDLGFVPIFPNNSTPDFSRIIPNLALKTTILNWCEQNNMELPPPPDYYSVESLIKSKWGSELTSRKMVSSDIRDSELTSRNMGFSEIRDLEREKWGSELTSRNMGFCEIRDSERDLLSGVENNRQILFSHAATVINPRNNYSYSSSSEESVVANVTPLLPFSTRPACYSSGSSPPSTSSEFVENLSPDDEVIVRKMMSLDVVEQEEGVILLRKTTRGDESKRVSLCNARLLLCLKNLMLSKYAVVQTNALASLVNLSLEKENKVKIVRSGVVPILIDVLKGGVEEAMEHAAGAIFSLALEDENKMAIGVLKALEPLLHAVRVGSERTRHDAALGLYHLSLVQSNRVKLIKLDGIGILLGLLKRRELVGKVVLVVCNLAACTEGRSALLDGNAVECLVGMLREGGGELDSVSTQENCVAALYSMSQGSLRFKGLAKEARAGEVLQVVVEKGSDRAREKAKRMLMMLRGRDEEDGEEEEEVDWEGVLEGKMSLARYRVKRNSQLPNTTEF
ncbi:hypothetical protein Leryth_003416 [Lithospermum erythrorhizon]|nr:hypothetical protein Leryth_003416 [Lithospermum erythrorhizon]